MIYKTNQITIILLLLFLAWLFSPSPSFASPADKHYNILVLHSYHKGLGWTDSISQGIEATLTKNQISYELFYEFLDSKRVADDEHTTNLANLFRHKYANRTFDAIILSDDFAFTFMLHYHDELFANTPVVFCGVNYFQESMIEGHPLFTGVVESFSLQGTIEGALQINPAIRTIVAIDDNTITGLANRIVFDALIPQYQGRLRFDFIGWQTMGEIQRHCSRLPDDAVVLLLSFTRDSTGEVFSLERSADLITPHCRVPVYSLWDFHLHHGVVGGQLTTGFSQGEKAGELALRILTGEPPASIPIVKESPNRYVFDYTIMRKFGIEEDRLPQGSTIINKPVSFYSQYKTYVWQTIAAFLLLFAVICVIGFNLIRRRTAEKALRRSEAALRESSERFRETSEMLPETIFEIDFTGKILFLNKAGMDQFGFTAEQLAGGLNAYDFFPGDEKTKLSINLQRLLQGEKMGLNEYLVRDKNGIAFPVMTKSALIYREGKAIGLRGFLIDITEKKQLEEGFQRAQRMESIGTLAGGIAHDFNNILMGIQGRTSLSMLNLPDTSPLKEHLVCIEEYVKSAANLTAQLLGFARSGKYHLKSTDLNEIIYKTSTMFGRTKKELTLVRALQEGLPAAMVDRNQIEQVLLNLYVNAWHAMPDGGRLEISTRCSDIDVPQGELLSLPLGRYLQITVTDSGIGIPEEIQQKIFEPFFTTKPRGRGTGLGLASAYGIIKNHNGTIVVRSKQGQGAAFTIYLPTTEEPAEYQVEVAAELNTGHASILLVDDEPMVAEVASAMLTHLGYTTHTARSGREAVDWYRTHWQEINMVVLDMIMPEMSGEETFNQLKAINPAVKVLLSSGYSLDGQAEKNIADGCTGFIQKPFDIQQFSQKISEVLGGGASYR